ncbi:unnamed protein product, partial [Prorocentrum cordatum]
GIARRLRAWGDAFQSAALRLRWFAPAGPDKADDASALLCFPHAPRQRRRLFRASGACPVESPDEQPAASAVAPDGRTLEVPGESRDIAALLWPARVCDPFDWALVEAGDALPSGVEASARRVALGAGAPFAEARLDAAVDSGVEFDGRGSQPPPFFAS